MDTYELAVDFMDMTDDRHLWTRIEDARPDLQPTIDCYVIVGDDDADPAVARVLNIDARGNIELEVLPRSVESHQDLVSTR